jgi:hypothetical protein
VRTLTPALTRHPSPYRRGEKQCRCSLSYRERVAAKLPGEGLRVIGRRWKHGRQFQNRAHPLENIGQILRNFLISDSQYAVALGVQPSVSSEIVLDGFWCVVNAAVNFEDEAGSAAVKIGDVSSDDFFAGEFCIFKPSISQRFPHHHGARRGSLPLRSSQFNQVGWFALHRGQFRMALNLYSVRQYPRCILEVRS